MPLSEEELRLLEQMERALVEEDPKFASTLRGTAFSRRARRRALVAALCFLVGIGVLMTGAITRTTLVGIIGFVIMLASATIGLAAWRNRSLSTQPRTHGPTGFGVIDGGKKSKGMRSPRTPKGTGSFMQRMEQRWQRRRDENGNF